MSKDSNQAKRQILLSELYASKGPLPKETVEAYRNAVSALSAKSQRTEEESLFINDFLSTIVDIKMISQPTTSVSKGMGQQVAKMDTSSSRALAAEGPAQVVKLNELVVIPEKFEGSRSKARRWLDDYERASLSNSWNTATMAKYFQSYLHGPASDWFAVLVQTDSARPVAWQDIRESFCKFYIGKDEDLALERSLKDSIQKPTESCSSFISRYARLLLLSDPSASQAKLINAIRIRLRPEFVERLSSHHLMGLEDLNLACSSIEDGLKASKAAEKLRREVAGQQTMPRRNYEDNKQTKQGAKKRVVCERCHRPGHARNDCFATKDKDGSELKDQAPKKMPPRGPRINAVATREEEESASEEEEDEEEERPKIVVSKKCSVIIANSSRRRKPAYLLHDVLVNGNKLRALIDTGSESCLINAETASINGLVPEGPVPELAAANNSPIKCFGYVKTELTIAIGKTTKTVENARFTVAENLCADVVIGYTMLGWLRILVDAESNSIVFKQEAKNIGLASYEILPPRSQKVVEASAPKGIVGAVQTIPFNVGDSGLMVANTIDQVVDGRVRCLVVNLDSQEKILKPGQQLAGYEVLAEEKKGHGSQVNAVMEVEKTQSFVNVGDNLDEGQMAQLKNLLSQFKQAFSIGGELGCTTLYEHDIELVEGAKPFSEPLRRRPIAHQEETQRQIKDMLDKGIIEESNSPWAAAYVLARKKSGEMRLCVDFRRLNDVTKKSVYPIPNVEDCIETLAGKKFFSQLDMASGFWQLPLSQRARELTSFRTETGQYNFRRMPFGLVNAPASFSRLVNIAFSGVKGLNMQVFIDDLCIASETWNEHISMLAKVFELLIKANLKLKCNKCTFGVPSVIFLGHEISSEGIRQDPSKLAAIEKLPVPTDVKTLRESLGMLNYYRKFVPNFAILAEPMNRLLKKKRAFEWGPEQQQSFEGVINELLKNGTLAHFDRSLPTALKTDACKTGIGAILLQQKDNEWRVVTCRSRKLKPNEQNYGVTELEALAVVEAVVKLRNYLLGVHFRIITDHCALCAVFKTSSTNSRLNRWRWILQEFSYDVIYTRGAMHSDVDCLSRAPLPDEVDDFLDDRVYSVRRVAAVRGSTRATPFNVEEWKKMVEDDTEAKAVQMKAKHRRDGFKMVEGLLYKNNRLFVPAPKRSKLVELAHSSEVAAHGGIKATLDRLDAFWWPGLQQDVSNFCDSCLPCQHRKTPRQRPGGQMRSFEASEAFELIAIDCLDYPESLNHRKHVIVAVDVFTRFVFGKAIKNLQAAGFVKFMMETFGRFGVPKAIVTDNAPFFANKQTESLASRFGFEHRFSTPHHHEGNAVAERMIQTVQEKVSIIVNRPDTAIDWEAAVPQAFLSINTAVCSSTGFSPYELTFGKKYHLGHDLFEFHDARAETYLAEKQQRLESFLPEANMQQTRAKERQKVRFDARHVAREFEVGEKVMARKMGRLNKLSTRWDGPFIVKQRRDDIYTIECETRKSKFDRHVSDMKEFKLAALVLLVTLVGPAQTQAQVDFERTPPIIWQETAKFVSPGFVNIKFRISFASPCPVLGRVLGQHHEEASQAVTRCETVYKDNISDRVVRFNEDPRIPVANQGAAGASQRLPVDTRLGPGGANALQQPGLNPGQFYPPPGQNNQRPNQQPNRPSYPLVKRDSTGLHNVEELGENPLSWLNQQPNQPSYPLVKANSSTIHHVEERDLGLGFAAGAVTYSVCSTLVNRVLDHYWPSAATKELADRTEQLKSFLNQMVAEQNVTQLALDAVQEAVVNQAILIGHNAANINRIAYSHPELMVASAHIISKLVLAGSDLDRLRISFRGRRPDLQLISLLTDTTFLDNVDQETIVRASVEATSPLPNTLELKFTARHRDTTTDVYEVEAFDFWANLTEEAPALLHYEGPKFLIFNHTNNCVKSVTDLRNRWVNARCAEPNYQDSSLASWSTIITNVNPWESRTRTTVKEAYPHVLVYCFPHNITLNGVQDECPPFVFRVNASEAFTLSTGYSYTPSAVEFNTAVELVTRNVQSIHFRNDSLAMNENRAIRRLLAAKAALREANEKLYLFSFSQGGGVSYFQSIIGAMLVAGALGLTSYVIYRSRTIEEERHQETKRALSNIYGAGIYEPVVQARGAGQGRGRSSSQPTTIINMTTIPTTASPLPDPQARA